jgi:hypothetical protein
MGKKKKKKKTELKISREEELRKITSDRVYAFLKNTYNEHKNQISVEKINIFVALTAANM